MASVQKIGVRTILSSRWNSLCFGVLCTTEPMMMGESDRSLTRSLAY
jgi:hypothetical protein